MYHQHETMLSERNRIDCNPLRNFYKNMCKFLRSFQKETDKDLLLLLIRDWNEERMDKSNLKKVCGKFGLASNFHRKYSNYEKFKTYQEETNLLTIALSIKTY